MSWLDMGTLGDIPCGSNYSGTLSSEKSRQHMLTPSPSLPISLPQSTIGMSLSVSPSQTAKSAWLPGLFLRSCGGDSAVSPSIDLLTSVTSSSRPFAPLLRPATPHNLVAPTFFVPLWLTVIFQHPCRKKNVPLVQQQGHWVRRRNDDDLPAQRRHPHGHLDPLDIEACCGVEWDGGSRKTSGACFLVGANTASHLESPRLRVAYVAQHATSAQYIMSTLSSHRRQR